MEMAVRDRNKCSSMGFLVKNVINVEVKSMTISEINLIAESNAHY